ncbi:hypothetical protein EJ02DRAFT_516411 [Clathrospora elynae]|uniref:Uncharacterized protein n=1 Tax=Clathrospora elynae TaxID=706981 RepID=A0A6A5S4C3_9PLEO|nr:hypothetical protein EJ02DRAFT_516411 [Clathrospora elynae]
MKRGKERQQKTYNSGDLLVVTHLTTNPPVHCLSTAERTGSSIFSVLWSAIMPPQRNAQPAYDEGILQLAIQGTNEDHKESINRVIAAFGVPQTTVQHLCDRGLPLSGNGPDVDSREAGQSWRM